MCLISGTPNQTPSMGGIFNGVRRVDGPTADPLPLIRARTRPRGFNARAVMFAKALVSALAVLVGIRILVVALEWMVPGYGTPVQTSGSRPVQLQPCPETCLVP